MIDELLEECLLEATPDEPWSTACLKAAKIQLIRAIPIIRKAVAEEIKRELEELDIGGPPFYKAYFSNWQAYWERRGT